MSIAGDSAMGCGVGRWRWPKVAWAPFAGLLLLVCGVYANSLRIPFLLDDRLTLVMEPTTHSWSNAARSAYGRRFGMLTFAANYAWGRTDVIGYHATNIAIHLLAGSCLWALARRLLRVPGIPVELSRAAEPLAWTIAALWMLHPLQTNAVTYTVQRFESLASLGMLAALYAVARHAATGRNTGSGIVWGALAVASGWMATQSKEISIGLPVLSVALSRAFFADSWKAVWSRQGWIHGGLAVASALLFYQSRSAFVAGPAVSAGFSVAGLTPWMYLRSQPAVILHYLRLTLWPDALCLDYGWPVSDSAASVYGLGAVILGLLVGTAYACVRAPRLGFLGLAFFTVLAPTSSFVPIADLAFEHRMYLPLASVLALLVLLGYGFLTLVERRLGRNSGRRDDALMERNFSLGEQADRSRITRRAPVAGDSSSATKPALAATLLVAVVIAGLSYRTVARNVELGNPELLWRQCIEINPTHVRPRVNYIGQLIAKGDFDNAIREGQEALRLGGHTAEIHSQMGTVYMKQGRLAEAERCFRMATEADPNYPMGWFNWATLCFQQSRHADSIRLYRRALDVHSVHIESWSGLGWSLELSGDAREAARCYRQALKLDPSLVVIATRLADLLATSDDPSLRSPVEALRMMESLAKRTRGRNPHILDTYAAALAANGRKSEATRVAQAALKLAPDKALRVRIESRLEAYKAERPVLSESEGAGHGR